MAEDQKDQAAAPTATGPMVKVKFLKNVGPYKEGQVVELPKDDADHVTAVTKIQSGDRLVENRKAVLLSEEHTLTGETDPSKMTQAEMDAKGLKNTIPSPFDSHVVNPTLTEQEIDRAEKEIAKEESENVGKARQDVHDLALEENKLRDEGKPVPPRAADAAPKEAKKSTVSKIADKLIPEKK